MESEHIMQYTLLGSALVAFLTGYLMSSYQIMLTIYLIGAGITLLVTVTDWAYFNRHPLEWIEPINLDIPNSRQLRLKQQKQQQQQEQFKFVNTYAATKR